MSNQGKLSSIINEADDDFVDQLYASCVEDKKLNDFNMIKFDLSFNKPNNFKPKEISFKDVDNYDFNKGFNEFIISVDKVHLYFDFDSVKTKDEFLSVVDWLNSLSSVFGEYSMGGYCNNDEMEEFGFRRFDEGDHYLSMHVVFYETAIKTEDLQTIMKHTDKKGFEYNVHQLCDHNVYKLVSRKEGQKTRQVFRHVLSDKIFKPGDSNNKENHGYILDGKKPSTQIVQVRGDEELIDEDRWRLVFKKKETKMEEKSRIKKERKEANFTIDDVDFEDKLIKFDENELQEFLKNYDPDFNVLMSDLAPLYHSPYKKEFLRKNFIEWYSSKNHEHDVEQTVDGILDRYYTKELNNKWFYSLVKKLPFEIGDKYLNQYESEAIDFTIDINNSNWSYETMRKRQYEKHEFTKLINDLRGIVGLVKGRCYVKERKEGQFYIRETTLTKIHDEICLYKPFKNNTKINLYHIVYKYSNWFNYDDAKFTLMNIDGVINFFQGFKYLKSKDNDYSPLQPFLYHIKHVVCHDDEDKYNYFMKWWSTIIKNVTVKNGTMLIIYGAQGSGKSIPVEIFCELMGIHALMNVDDIEKVFGKFNGLIARHIVIVINEPPDASERFAFAGRIKAKLTQKKTIQETKGVDSIEIESWANFCITTNNPNPIIEEKGNRRFIYYECNNEKCGDEEYFNELMKNIQPIKQGPYNPEFMSLLYRYMTEEIDTNDFNTESLIRAINRKTNVEYNEQLERQYLDLNSVDKFVVDNYKLFEYGYALDDIKVEGYKEKGLAKKLLAICEQKRMRRNQYQKLMEEHQDIYGFREVGSKAQFRVYTLKPKEQIPDLFALIEYRRFGDSNEEEDMEDTR